MIITPETIDALITTTLMTPAIALSTGHDDHGSAMGPGAKAVGIGFLVLILANGNMPANTQFAIIIGIAAYFFFSKGSKPAAGGH